MRDLTAVKAALKEHEIELPSWAFGNSGTRFKVFGQPGVPRTPWEKAEDVAQVHRFTGVAPRMAVHIPWDKVDDYAALARHAGGLGIRIGAVNANVFQDEDYKLGSVCNPDPRVRKKAVGHLLECVDVMDATGSRDLKLWFADGTNYPGQDDIRARQDRLAEALATVYARLGGDQRMLLEYKLFEPSFYTTDVPDWGTSLLHCQALGPKAQVVVDTGHHAPGTNIEFIVAQLLRLGRLGSFDFNSLTGVGDLGAAILKAIPPEFQAAVQPYIGAMVEGVHGAFSLATAQAFWLGVFGSVVAFGASLAIKEIPLRTSNEQPVPTQTIAQVAAQSATGAAAQSTKPEPVSARTAVGD